MTKDEFLDECRFAKIVDTDQGPGLLIAGHVLRVTGPDDFRIPTDPEQNASYAQRTDYAGWLAEALRNYQPSSGGRPSGQRRRLTSTIQLPPEGGEGDTGVSGTKWAGF